MLKKIAYNYVYKKLYWDNDYEQYDLLGDLAWSYLLRNAWGSVKVHITDRCNYGCEHCYGRNKNSKDITPAQMQEIVAQSSFKKKIRMDILGGEPLLHSHLYELISCAKKAKNVTKIQLYTNASLIDAKKARELKKNGVDNAIVSLFSPHVPFDGRTREEEEILQNKVKGINALKNAQIATYAINIMHSKNLDTIAHCEEWCQELGVRTIYFPYVRQKPNDRSWCREKEKYHGAIGWSLGKSKKFKQKMLRKMLANKTVCLALLSTITVRANGDVSVCPFALFSLGNIYEDSMHKILKRALNLESVHEFLKIPDSCRTCSVVKLCSGGCKANYSAGLTYDNDYRVFCKGPYTSKISMEEIGKYVPFFE